MMRLKAFLILYKTSVSGDVLWMFGSVVRLLHEEIPISVKVI